jgi:cellulose synthase/poly-beta-1,6-N-acetylglucosamine synthase-like glycosyltransferase
VKALVDTAVTPRAAPTRTAGVVSRATVVIPTYNYGRFVGAAIQSALEQCGGSPEVIVVDDGSTDDTREIVARFPDARYVWQTNQGVAAALNRGAAEAHGELFCFLGADDMLAPGAFERHLAYLDAHEDVDAVVGAWAYVDDAGAPLPQAGTIPPGPLTADQIVRGVWQPATPGASLVRRAAFERLGGFDGTVSPAEDLDFWIRLAAAGGRIIGADYPAIRIRVHGRNASGQADVMAKQIGTVYERFADTAPDGHDVRRTTRFYAGLAQAAGHRAGGDVAGWRALLLAPAVETSPAWLSPDGFLRLAYLLIPHGWRTRDVLYSRSAEITGGLVEALDVLRTGPSHTRRRTAAGWLAVAQIHLGARDIGRARGALSNAAAADPTVFTTRPGAGALARAFAPAPAVASSRRLRKAWRVIRGTSRV